MVTSYSLAIVSQIAVPLGICFVIQQTGTLQPLHVWVAILVGAAGLNAAFFHARGGLARPDAVARAQTVLSLGLWLGAIICGRGIAYL